MKILIVGGTGYVGARLNQHLSDKGHEVFITSRKPQSTNKNIIIGDVTDVAFFKSLASQKFDAVVYTVSLNHTESNSNLDRAVEINVTSTWRCLEAFSKTGTKRLIYFSTQQVYGPFTPGRDFHEAIECRPHNIYGLTHLMSEDICNYYFNNSELKSVSVRLSNSVGTPVINSAHISSLVALDLCKMCVKDGVIKLKSDGSPQRDFIAMTDVCQGIETLVTSPKLKYSTYNLGAGKTITLGELALKIARIYETISGKKTKVLRNDGSEIKPGSTLNEKRFAFSTARLSEQGFTATHSLDSALAEILTGV